MSRSDFRRKVDGRCCARRRRVVGGVFSRLIVTACGILIGASPSDVLAQLQGLWTASQTIQANGMSVQMPLTRPLSGKSKLGMTVDTRWANNYGYRPLEVTVTAPKPATTDRFITIRLHMTGWGWQSGVLTVEQDFELPLGQTSAQAIIMCPLYRMEQQYMWWDVWVDGVKDDDLSMEKNTSLSRMNAAISPSGGAGVTCLIVGPTSRNRTLTAPSTMEFEALSLAAADFPQHWLGYTCFDVVSLSNSELQTIARSNPAALDALRSWVRTGGQLWVTELGEKFDQLPEVSKLLHVPDTLLESLEGVDEETADAMETENSKVGWKQLRFLRGNPEGQVVTFLNLNTNEQHVARDPDEIARLQDDPNFVATSRQFRTEGDRPRRRWPEDSSQWFVEQRMGLGTVRAFRNVKDTEEASRRMRRNRALDPRIQSALDAAASWGVDPAPLLMMGAIPGTETVEAPELPPALALGLRSTRRWSVRHGMTPDNANLDFAKLLVPGVGLAPVTEFRVLITLFVLLIGPGNYWLLKRFRRLHLLVLTVPLAALLTTTGLFAYALISDGFGTSVRVHSFTALDQRTGDAACWARLSYYAGLAPGDGLKMPRDVAVYPIVPGWNDTAVDANLGSARDMAWERDEARLTRGWLRSRTPTQYLTIRSRKSPYLLELLSANGKLRTTNKLESRIEFVVAIDDQGKLFVGENIPVDARAFLEPISRPDAIRQLRGLIVDNEPQAPEALAGGESEYQLLQRRQLRRTFGRSGTQYGEERLGSNLVSDAMSQLAGLEGQPALDLPPRSYVAITDTGPEVELGMTGLAEEMSFHVIVGQW